MKKIALTAAALLAISGAAFAAGSDHYGSQDVNQLPASSIDSSHTASVKAPVNSDAKSITDDSHRLGGNS